MTINFDDFVEQVRDASPIENILEESGIKLRGHGRLRTGMKHDSLKVRTDMQRMFWYSMNLSLDVFGWVMHRDGIDFNEALEKLAERAKIDMPKNQARDEGEIKRVRATADTFSVAANVFQRWLMGDEKHDMKADADALAYVQGRAWTDETILAELTGFSGRKSEAQIKDMLGDFSMYGIDPRSAAAVAVLGLRGDVDAWAKEQGVRDHEDFDEEWIAKGRIHGLMDTPGLIYGHKHRGGVNYLSRRQLPGFDKIKDKGSDKQREWKSFNPYKLLAGAKQVYFNHVHRIDKPLILVEGQGDAITWGQWGHGSMAFCGLLGDVSQMTPEDAEKLRRLAAYINKHPAVYLQLDDDEAGQKAIKLAAGLLGPKMQIVRMIRPVSREDAKAAIEAEKAETVENVNEADNVEE